MSCLELTPGVKLFNDILVNKKLPKVKVTSKQCEVISKSELRLH